MQTLYYANKSFKRLVRNRTAVFFVFLFPVLMLLMLGSIFGGETGTNVSGITVGVVNLDYQQTMVNGSASTNGTFSDAFISAVKEVNLTVVETPSVGDPTTNGTALYLLNKGAIDAYLVIPTNFTECLSFMYSTALPNGSLVPLAVSPSIEIVVDPTDPLGSQIVKQVLIGIVNGFSKAYQEVIINMAGGSDPMITSYMEFLASPVNYSTYDADITSVRISWINFMVPGTLGLVIIWAGLSTSARSFAFERDTGSIRRLVIAPISPVAILIGEYLYTLFVVLLSSILSLLTGVLVFHVSLNWDLLALLVFTLAVSLSAVGPGLIISSLAKNAYAAGSIQNIIAIPLQFFTGSFFPLFLLPAAGQAFAMSLPYTQYSLAVSDIMVKGFTIVDVLPSLVYITIVGLAFMLVGVFTFRRALRNI